MTENAPPPIQVAHISDLHVGRDAVTNTSAGRLALALTRAADLDWICCTGDVTHNGRAVEGRTFARLFGGLRPRLTVVPGNHDRMGDNVAAVLSRGALWERTVLRGRLRLLCLDSTQPINATGFIAQGEVEADVVARLEHMVLARDDGQSVLVLVHHHLVPSAPDGFMDLLADMQRLPFAGCLRHGEMLAKACVGRVAAVLHGHKHRATVQHFEGLPVVNAGSTTSLGRFRVLTLSDNVVTNERWVPF